MNDLKVLFFFGFLDRKTSRSQSNLLEIIQLSSHKEMPRKGLRLIFPDALFPFAFVYKDEVSIFSLVLFFGS